MFVSVPLATTLVPDTVSLAAATFVSKLPSNVVAVTVVAVTVLAETALPAVRLLTDTWTVLPDWTIGRTSVPASGVDAAGLGANRGRWHANC